MADCEERGFHTFADAPQPWIGDADVLIAQCVECEGVFTSDNTDFLEAHPQREDRFRFCRHRQG